MAERGHLGAGADGAGHEAGRAVGGEVVGHLAGDAGGGDVDLVGSVGEVVLGQRDGEGAEGGGLGDVGADGEVALVQAGDDVGPGEGEQLVAALELVAVAPSNAKSSAVRSRVWT